MNNLDDLQNVIGYKFKEVGLLQTALTHQSYANDNKVASYERLEFLGDAVLELVVSDYIYHLSEFDAGVSTRLRAGLVSTEYLNNVSNNLGLPSIALKSKSLPQLSKKNTADLFESLVGAVYLDGGMDNARRIIHEQVIISESHIGYVMRTCVDYKTKLQELLQAGGESFEYKLVSSSGLDHEKIFEVGLFVNKNLVVKCQASSIRSAEEKCAEKYLTQIINS